MANALLLGCTGLVGNEILTQLLLDRDFDKVIVLVRQPLPFTHPKLEERVVDFQNPSEFELAMQGGEIIFSAVGTTQKKVKGDAAAYRKVDEWIPTKAAEFGAKWGAKSFLLVSAIGADAQSKNFYLKLKGEVETQIKKSGIPLIFVFQPSLLLGNRGEFRLGERMAQWIFPIFRWLTPSKYRAVEAKDLAKAMVHCSKSHNKGHFTLTYADFFPAKT
jgi:uncharacterized protein YbjT (DUF2867 family)